MNYEVVYTDNFKREFKKLAKKYHSIRSDLECLLDTLEENPVQGIAIGMDCYKIRMAIASKGKGKSGGARVITHLYVDGNLVYLLSIYDKSDRETITNKEIETLLKYLQ
ncbi:MAG: type II toxin-antitoxin system RelE/ParE family toxin [Cyclobacteriaceae bacterium]|nr:type II toxin-antitoxin system RelE/ParE family toxin [Cyclobacteriaceae bacterium]